MGKTPSTLYVLGLTGIFILAGGTTAEAPNPEVTAHLEAGQKSLAKGHFQNALEAFKAANKAAGEDCLPCRIGLMQAFQGTGEGKRAAKYAEAVLKLSEDPGVQGLAYNVKGLVLLAEAKDDPDGLAEAETAFRRALELSRSDNARFNLGLVLLRRGEDEEGVALLREYLERNPDSPTAARARSLIENPMRARKNLVADLEMVTLEGEPLLTEELRGKVVLLDFWGTWCGPCRAAVPSLNRLNRRMEDDPFVLISVSNDGDEDTLRGFIAENKMTWPQVWDLRHDVIRHFNVTGYPTYLLIDHEGEILFRTQGWGNRIEADLMRRVGRAVKVAKKRAR